MMKSILLVLVLAIVQQQSVVQADISFTRSVTSTNTNTGRRRMLRSRSASAAAAAADVTPAVPAERQLSDEEEPEDDYEEDVYLGTGCEQTNEDGDEDGENDCEDLVPVKCETEEEEAHPVAFDCLPKCKEGQEQFDENKRAKCYLLEQ